MRSYTGATEDAASGRAARPGGSAAFRQALLLPDEAATRPHDEPEAAVLIDVLALHLARALVRGRDYVLAEDLLALAKDALRHRLVLTYQALAEEVTADSVLDRVLAAVPVPELDLGRASAA